MAEKLVQSLLRGIDIIELVSEAKDGIKLKDICDKLGLKVPTAHNLLKTLVSREFLIKGDDARYMLGPKLMNVGLNEMKNKFFTQMEKVFFSLHKTFPDAIIVYTEYLEGEIKVIMRMIPEKNSVMHPRSSLRLYASASGLVHLAFADHHERINIGLANPFWETAAHLWGSQEKLAAYLQDVLKSGVALYPFRENEYYRFALPVFARSNCLRGALGVSLLKKNYSGSDKTLCSIIDTVKDKLKTIVEDKNE